MVNEQAAVGTGGMLCAHCGRPMACGVLIGGRQYHEECTHGPSWQQQQYLHPSFYRPTVEVPNTVPLGELIRKWREDPAKAAELDAAKMEFRGWLVEELHRLGLLKVVDRRG